MAVIEEKKGLDSLQVWQRAIKFAIRVCQEIIPTFPETEKYSLATQLRRSVQSVPANIAEGFGRYYYLDAIRHCLIARGSLEETYSHLTLANGCKYISDDEFQRINQELGEIRRMLDGYINFLRKRKQGEMEGKMLSRESDGLYTTGSEDIIS